MNKESTLRRVIVQTLRAKCYLAQSIESGSTGLGIPDLYIRTDKIAAWIELKNFRFPISYPVKIPFRPKQREWLNTHTKLGGLSLLIISEPKGVHVFVNKNIKCVYKKDLALLSDLTMPKFNCLAFVEFLHSRCVSVVL